MMRLPMVPGAVTHCTPHSTSSTPESTAQSPESKEFATLIAPNTLLGQLDTGSSESLAGFRPTDGVLRSLGPAWLSLQGTWTQFVCRTRSNDCLGTWFPAFSAEVGVVRVDVATESTASSLRWWLSQTCGPCHNGLPQAGPSLRAWTLRGPTRPTNPRLWG